MPRSGTTLAEQIISAHPDVRGCGELLHLADLVMKHVDFDKKLELQTLKDIRDNYFFRVGQAAQNTKYFTDKMPQNFRWLGIILAAFPDAKIVYLNRNPSAVCWSIFKGNFNAPGLGFCDDLKKTVHYYNLHIDLMKFWFSKFPNQIITVDYEKLTDNQEKETRKLIKEIGLPWCDGFLAPEKNSSTVNTLSALQVRQPIYQGSSSAWKKFAPFIGDAFDEIDSFD